MGLLPALIQSTRGGLVVSSNLALPKPAREPVSALAECAKSSMFAEMLLDNRTDERIHGHLATPFN
jgi:hypothetical protein